MLAALDLVDRMGSDTRPPCLLAWFIANLGHAARSSINGSRPVRNFATWTWGVGRDYLHADFLSELISGTPLEAARSAILVSSLMIAIVCHSVWPPFQAQLLEGLGRRRSR